MSDFPSLDETTLQVLVDIAGRASSLPAFAAEMVDAEWDDDLVRMMLLAVVGQGASFLRALAHATDLSVEVAARRYGHAVPLPEFGGGADG